MTKTIVLLSGGLDSATCLGLARRYGDEIYALSFRYGQRHAIELERAKALAQWAEVKEHRVVDIDLRAFGGSALTADIPVPKDGTTEGIPVTYVPGRNTIFLSFALAMAEVIKADIIFTGVNAIDYSGYPDCRPEFIDAMREVAKRGFKDPKVEIIAPLLHLSKRAIVRLAKRYDVPIELTSSCYDPAADGAACGRCDSCRIRLAAFEETGYTDPIAYQK